jgi:hypothetical protein
VTLTLALQDEVEPGTDLSQPLADLGVSTWLYLGDDSEWRIAVERSSLAHLPRRSAAAELQHTAAALRRPLIDAIGQLSLLNDSLEWWASELATKRARRKLFGQLCSLAVVRHLIEEGLDDCLVVCSTSALLEEVTAAGAAARAPVVRFRPARIPRRRVLRTRISRLLRRRLVGRALGRWAEHAPTRLRELPGRIWPRARLVIEDSPAHRRSVLERLGAGVEPFAGEDTALLFTWADERSVAADGTYTDPYFGWLAEALRKRGFRVAFVLRYSRHGGISEDFAKQLLTTGERMIFPELLIDAGVQRACRKQAAAFVPQIPADMEVEGVPFARLARQEDDELRSTHAKNLTYAALVERLAQAGVRPRLLIHLFEGDAWEKVLAFAARRHLPEARVVGYDNMNMSRLTLSLYPAQVELGRRPLPDRIVTNGPAFHEVLLTEGMPPDLVRVGCGLRHADLWDGSRPRRVRAREQVVVLVAPEFLLNRATELVEKAVEAFGGDARYEVVVKYHPLTELRAVESLSAEAARHGNVVFSRSKIGELLPEADLVLYTYSSVGYEALAQGVPPVFVQSETDLDLDQLEPFADLRWAARTAQELRAAARSLNSLKPDERDAWRVRAQEAVRSVLAPIGEAGVEAVLD